MAAAIVLEYLRHRHCSKFSVLVHMYITTLVYWYRSGPQENLLTVTKCGIQRLLLYVCTCSPTAKRSLPLAVTICRRYPVHQYSVFNNLVCM
jgi:hypothetical protein